MVPHAEEFGSVEVDYSVGDIVALQLAAWRYWLRIAAFPFFLIAVLSIIPVVTGEEDFPTAVASTDWYFAALLSIIVVGALMLTMAVAYAIRRFQGKHENIALGIGEDGAFFHGPDSEGTVFWKSLTRVWANEQRLMLFLSSNNALIISRRYFSDSATFDRWVNFSKARFAAAKSRVK